MSRKALGRVANIRLSPKDCMAIQDIVIKLGYPVHMLSFAQGCRIALSSFLEGARQHGHIPTRDGFEYLEMMNKWQQDNRTPQPFDLTHQYIPPVIPAPLPDAEQDTKKRRRDELSFKMDHDPLNVTPKELEEFQLLDKELL